MMKTERRHELQKNSLAAWIEDAIERFKPHGTAITMAVVGAIALGFVYYFLTSQRASNQLQAWNQYLQAVEEPGFDRLEELGQQYSSESVGLCSMLIAADRQLQQGVDALFGDRTAALQDLNLALDNYTQVAQEAHDPLLIQRGLIGKGFAEESLIYDSAANLEAAKETYQKYLTDFPEGVYAKTAQIRLNALGRAGTASFYDWFSEQVAGTTETPDDIPGLSEGTELDTLPEGPDSSSPVFESQFDTAPDETVEMEEETVIEEPATEETPAEEEAPATEEPATEPSATEEPAAEEPAAGETPSSEETTPES